MPDEIQIITTGDGSHSLLNTSLNETYHSVHGARRESVHVFINHGLHYFRERNPDEKEIRIFEVGFGTGLNALLTASYAREHSQKVSYTSVEAFPLDEEIWRKLNYASTNEERALYERMHGSPWQQEQFINDFFSLRKVDSTLQRISLADNAYNIIFYDAFAPSKQPELWELPVLEPVCNALKGGGVFVTYCAKGQLKRDLKSVGLEVQTLPGPPGKKEMVRALKI